METEENSRNPEITRVEKIKIENYFLIKYQNERDRIAYSELVMRLVKNFELKDFRIEEKQAFEKPRVFYNMHTILKEGEYDYEKLKEEFLKYYKN